MYDRRDFLRATGAALGTGLVSGAASAQYDQFEGYRLVGEAPVPGIYEVVTRGDWAYAASEGALATININDPTMPFLASRVDGEDGYDTLDAKVAGDVAAVAHNEIPPGISLFDVSDPGDPSFESFYTEKDTIHNCDLHLSTDGRVYAYLCVSDSFNKARMVTVDVTDPANPQTLEGEGDYTDGPEVPDEERGTGGAWMLQDAQAPPVPRSSSGTSVPSA